MPNYALVEEKENLVIEVPTAAIGQPEATARRTLTTWDALPTFHDVGKTGYTQLHNFE